MYKRQAAERAIALVRPGMTLGLGSGTTSRHFVDLLGAKVRNGLEILGVATSQDTERQARGLAIPLASLDEAPELDLTVDGADEIDDALHLIKGGGGALLREKIVASASRRMVVIADISKRVARLGRFALPVEVVPFGLVATTRHLERAISGLGLGGAIELRRRNDEVFITDGGHYILDCGLGAIADPAALAAALAFIPGVVDHGLFIGLASAAIVAGPSGVEILGTIE
ncbi:MAG: ribose-5-phosphate isomerase RpiA [Bradyrhizobium sp.]|nr:MAG: ribose-5-phosphate isomerase RpiA [Bradyrhizobium sp.]